MVGALETSCGLHLIHCSLYGFLLNAPGLNIRRVVLSDEAADRVSVHSQDLDRVGVASFLVEHHEEVVGWLNEGPRNVVPDDCQAVVK